MSLNKVVTEMKEEITGLLKDIDKPTNKSAAKRCRIRTLKLRDLGKEYRKLSIK